MSICALKTDCAVRSSSWPTFVPAAPVGSTRIVCTGGVVERVARLVEVKNVVPQQQIQFLGRLGDGEKVQVVNILAGNQIHKPKIFVTERKQLVKCAARAVARIGIA